MSEVTLQEAARRGVLTPVLVAGIALHEGRSILGFAAEHGAFLAAEKMQGRGR